MNKTKEILKTYAGLVVLVLIFLSFYYLHLYEYLKLDKLSSYQDSAQLWTSQHYFSAVGIYIVIYITMIACAIPCATFLTIGGGFIFGLPAFAYALFSTTVGGIGLYLSVRSAFGTKLVAKSSGWIKRLEKGFQKNAFNYLLMLRLVPVMPCWVSNITAGVLNVPLSTFISATLLGIFPATLIYVLIGRGLDQVITQSHLPMSQIILHPSVLFPLIGLAFLSIFPVIYKSMKKA